jgi:simple sugar transport system substrate-binding protein
MKEKSMKTRICLLFLVILTIEACTAPKPISMATPTPTTAAMPVTRPTAMPVLTPTTRPLPTKAQKTYKDMVVGYVMVGAESDWRVANTTSFKETAEKLGISIRFYDSMIAGTRYMNQAFQQFLEDPKVNVIVLTPIVQAGWDEMLQKAKDAGKIVVITDRRVDAPEDLYATFVSSDFTEEGRKAGREMCKLLEGSEKKNVWELAGTAGSWAEMERGTGFRETATQCGIVIANSETGNFVRAEGKQVTEAWLKKGRDVQGIFAQNDNMAMGAIEALKEAGLKPGADIKIVSIDAIQAAFEAMINGELNVTVECNPSFAPQVYAAALAALNGETLPKWIPVHEGVFRSTDENLEEVLKTRRY